VGQRRGSVKLPSTDKADRFVGIRTLLKKSNLLTFAVLALAFVIIKKDSEESRDATVTEMLISSAPTSNCCVGNSKRNPMVSPACSMRKLTVVGVTIP